MSIGSFATEGRVDVQGNELNIGDKVYVAIHHSGYYKSDQHSSLEVRYVVGGYNNNRYVNVSAQPPFKGEGTSSTVYTKNCILIKE